MKSRKAPEPDRRSVPERRILPRLFLPLLGLLSLGWFLLRVIPKPSRATYPCQRAAFPLASAFVIWVAGVAASTALGLKARTHWRSSKPGLTLLFAGLAALVVLPTLVLQSSSGQAALAGIRNALLPSVPPLAARYSSGDSLTVTPEAVVGVTKSAQAQATDIDFAEITTMVNEAIAYAGGFAGLIADGDTVVLKPNLIGSQDFTAALAPLNPTVNGVATDYRVIQAVVDAVRDLNPSGTVFLMEGSGVGITSSNMANLHWDLVTGLDSLICLEDEGAWFDTTSAELVGVSLPEGKALYTPAENRYWLSKLYYEADVLISLPVLKNHFVSGVTGAVKNVGIGATPPLIYGLGSHYPNPYERSQKINHGYSFSPRNALHNWIHDFYMCRPVDFVIMDGLQGIENGPLCHEFINGTQEISEDQKNARLILAGRDAIAVDAIASLLCGHDPALVGHLAKLHNDSLGCADPRMIRIVGAMVGVESQDYEINDSGSFSKHSDFTPPWFSIRACEAIGGELHLYLDADPEVTKVEATVNGVWLSEIRLGEFESFAFDLDTLTVGIGDEVVVYAYDAYLNHSSAITLVGTSAGIGAEAASVLRIWPSPCRTSASIQYALQRPGMARLSIFTVDGRRVKSLVNGEQTAGPHRIEWNADGEAAGVYFIKLESEDGVVTRKIVKIE